MNRVRRLNGCPPADRKNDRSRIHVRENLLRVRVCDAG